MRGLIRTAAIAAALITAAEMSPAERDAERERYCEMVSQWHADEAAGVPPHHRAGWPPYDGECHE